MLSLLLLPLLMVASDDPIVISVLSSPRDIEVQLKLDRVDAARMREASEEQSRWLSLAIEDNGKLGLPVFAKLSLEGDRIVLRPRYRLAAETTYVVTARLPDGTSVQRTYRVPKEPAGPPPRVLEIFPSSNVLPANCLKFYIHFSQPIRQGREIFEHIQLVDDRGKTIQDPWRRAELWNAERDRLTLWIHPGRIKQGVNLREDFGPVLKPNRRFQLVITTLVRNLAGVSLEKQVVKSFRTTEEDHQRPDPRRWKTNQVRVGSRDALIVKLGEPLDRALLQRFVTASHEETKLDGSVAIEAKETTWTFRPAQPWSRDQDVLTVNGRLEDLAGNTPFRVFDTDVTLAPIEKPTLQIPIMKLPD